MLIPGGSADTLVLLPSRTTLQRHTSNHNRMYNLALLTPSAP